MLILPPVIGHRGAAGTAPENTLASLARAAELGATWVEIDVQLTRDGRLVLMHDLTLPRTTDGRGRVAAARSSELQRLDAGGWFGDDFAGEPVPTLEQAVELVLARGLGLNVEIKAEAGRAGATGEAAGRLLAAHWPTDRPAPLISGADPQALVAARATAPQLPRALIVPRLRWTSVRWVWAKLAAELGCAGVVLDQRPQDAERMARVGAGGGALCLYTVNDPARAAQLYAWGATTLFSDHPERLLDLVMAGRPA